MARTHSDTVSSLVKQCNSLYSTYINLRNQFEYMYSRMSTGDRSLAFQQNLQDLLIRLADNAHRFDAASAKHHALCGNASMIDKRTEQQVVIRQIESTIRQYVEQAGETPTTRQRRHFTEASPQPQVFETSSRQWQGPSSTYSEDGQWGRENTLDQGSFPCSCLDLQLQKLVNNSVHNSSSMDGIGDSWLEDFQNSVYNIPTHTSLLPNFHETNTPMGQSHSNFFQVFTSLVEQANAAGCDVRMLVAKAMIATCPNSTFRRGGPDATGRPEETTCPRVPPYNVRQENNLSPPCMRCGKKGHNPDDCFTRKSKCPICHRLGHSKKKCRDRSTSTSTVGKGNKNPKSHPRTHVANAVDDADPKAEGTPTVPL